MITSDDLAKLRVRRIIFHDVPHNRRGGSNKPILADTETEIDPKRREMLKVRLTQVINSSAAYPIEFRPDTGSPVPVAVKDYTAKAHTISQFVQMSQLLANYLFEQQGGAISSGLLCVIDVTSGGNSGLALLKLEREQGAQLALREENGQRMYEMSVLDDLVLTDGTRLFKSALFIRDNGDFRCAACDSQRKVTTSEDVAQFWMRFLGCQVTQEPRVATQKWFEATVSFVNEHIDDPIAKNDLYEHLISELKSNRSMVSPRKFIENYVPDVYRKEYGAFLSEAKISLHSFQKDISDIDGRLRRRSFYTSRGVSLTVPVDAQELVEIGAENILVHDHLQSVAHK